MTIRQVQDAKLGVEAPARILKQIVSKDGLDACVVR